MARTGRWRLAQQVAAVTTAVTVVAVAVSFLVSANLIHRAADTQARQTLGHYADLVADGSSGSDVLAQGRLRPARPAVRVLYRLAHITPVRVRPDSSVVGTPPGPLPGFLLGDASRGVSTDATITLAGRGYFASSRPFDLRTGSIVLLEPRSAVGSISSPLRSRVLIALGIGLIVAVLAGAVLARRLARPLVRAADAAHTLAAGDRDLRLEPAGPAEMVAVGESLNRLAEALGSSEARQRDFLLSVSHELRTPLTAISGYAEALSDGVIEATDVPGVGRTMAAESARLGRLVEDLMELGRLGADDFAITRTDVDIDAVLRDAGEVWAARCTAAGIELRLELVADETVLTDPGRLRQVVDGLAENALRVTPAGSPLVLATRVNGDAVEVEVRDGGPGLTDDDLAVVFQRWVLNRRYVGNRPVGTGIGLALIAALVERLGGRIESGHAPEGGARFTVSLPR